MKFSYVYFEKEITNSMHELEKAFQKEDTLKTICYLKYLSSLYYSINYKLVDDRLEEITKQISLKYLGNTVIERPYNDRVVFYDNFGLANRGLANIYVKALAKLGYKVTWILYAKGPDIDEIQEMYRRESNIAFYIIPQKPILERMKILRNIIKEISPRHLFTYTVPNDADGIGTISTIKGNVERYLIDLTDHAFWLGKCATDWVIDSRNYGYNVAIKYRLISPNKIIFLPYYPDPRSDHSFEGMPFDINQYQFVFSGGSPYKIEGDNAYKEIVEYILQKYTFVRFVYASNSTNQVLENLKDEFPDRFFLISERKDLDAILEHAKFYLSTYPISGALMAQYAARNECIPIALCNKDYGIMDVKTWFVNSDKVDFVYYNKKDLFNEIDKLMCDDNYYIYKKNKVKQLIISENEFVTQLEQVLNRKKTAYSVTTQNISIESFLAIYKKNANYEQYCKIIFDSKNKWVYKKHPFIIRKMKKKKCLR